ncbi:hypothetical protein SESBI_21367 [Sesbania bispinosa]|nr:hypothetical protein SESBI_21367 [Sesbania bispinosa]
MANSKLQEDKRKRWISYMETMIGSVRNVRVKPSTIFNVREELRKSREEAYAPKVVSIGPLHRGTTTRRELVSMEEIKWRCMCSFLFRTENPVESLSICSEAIHTLDDVVRTTYVDEIKFDSYDLANIMLLDGCFLLELLITNEKSLDDKIKSRSLGPGAEVGKMEAILSDLKLLENQIPLFILPVLFKELFVEYPQNYESLTQEEKDKFEKESNEMVKKIVNGLVLFLFSCSSESNPVESPNCGHLLELIHWFMTREDGDGINRRNNHHSITVERNFYSSTKPNLKLCAERLEAVGVKIRALDEDSIKKGSMLITIRLKDKKEAMADSKLQEDKRKRWISYMETMIGSVRNVRVKPSTIFNVREELRKSREEAYAPKVVSIGPLHRGTTTRRELVSMEEIKWRCMRSLLFRTENPVESLSICSEAIHTLDDVVRTTYVDEIKFDSYDLASIILLDGCFLLELLITNEKSLDDKIKSRSLGPGAEVGKMEAILSDLKLLEN